MSMIGKSLAHYEVTAEIGKGGMGEVYQAMDRKLGRDVAIKVLPEEFARDADRIARFQREAKLLASLNHPNIAAIHGLEEDHGTHFLVMELIEGNTLAERIKGGPIPVEEALKLALQIAEALVAAHEKGVIHRDLKPANIKVTPDGKVKVLDFGLAKAFAGDPENINLSNSPTLSDAATQQGVILGTAAYMSPEQARGKPVDRRADIWAFGAVLYEMLTGEAAFLGKDVTDTLAAVIRSEPEWKSLPANLHWRLRELIERCLEKDAGDRYGSINDARIDIRKVLTDPGGVFARSATETVPRRNLRWTLSWVAAAVILTAIVVGTSIWNLRKPAHPQVTRFFYELPAEQDFDTSANQTVAVSPDGSLFAYGTREGLYLRPLGELDARLVQGTANDNPSEPLFSPDLKWIVYYSLSEQKIKKVPIGGGVPMTICAAPLYGGMNWGSDNTILYGGAEENSSDQNCMMQVSANGGIPSALFKEQAVAIGRPQMLPGGKSVLFTELSLSQGTIIPKIMAYSLESGKTREITAGYIGRYLPTGHLVYTTGVNMGELTGNLLAVPFDPDRLETTGEAVPLGEAIAGFLGVRYDVSGSGTLAYVPGLPGTGTGSPAQGLRLTPVWVDRQGKEEELPVEPDIYLSPKISPDGTKVAFSIGSDLNSDIWIVDPVGGNRTRLTFDEGEDAWPIWTPDGKQILYRSSRDQANYDINRKPADGFGEVEKIVTWPNLPGPFSWSKDGKILLSWDLSLSAQKTGISMLSLENEPERIPLIDGKFNEDHPQISPDGRWLAYASNESGQHEVYVCPFPDVKKGRWQVSTGGGYGPLWSPKGGELFYRNKESVMAVAVETDPVFKGGRTQELFNGSFFSPIVAGAVLPMWDIHPDGKRFLMIKAPQLTNGETTSPAPNKIIVVTNWFEELKDRVPME